MWCRLGSNQSPKWKFMEIPNFSFNGYSRREALVVENKIVYFGSSDENASFVQEEGEESGKLKVARKD